MGAFFCSVVPAYSQQADRAAPSVNGDTTSLPPVEDPNQPIGTKVAGEDQSNPIAQTPEFQTSTEAAVNAGLVPVFDSSTATSATASGLVSGFPGLTSFGAQAASAAEAARKPISVFATQSLAYSDNPGQTFEGQTLGTVQSSQFRNQPDEYEVTSFGALLSRDVGLQNFFASANFGLTRYFHDTNFDSTRYNISVGDDFAFRDVCTGVIVANQSQSAVPLEFTTLASATTETSQNSSFEINTSCKVTGHIFTLTDFRVNSSSFSDAASAADNSKQVFGSFAVQYSDPAFVVFGLIASVEQTQFSQRADLNETGLATGTSQTNFGAYLTKPISPKINVTLSAGIVDLATGGPSLAGSIAPTYSASLSYRYSPKTSFNFSLSHQTSSPQSIIANFEQIDTINFGVNYRLTPRTGLSGSVGQSKTSSGGGQSAIATATALQNGINTTNIFEQVGISYKVASNASAALTYQHIERQDTGLNQTSKSNVVSLSVNYSR